MTADFGIDSEYQLTLSSNGDAAIISDNDCVFQTLCLEAVCVEGDLWYEPDWGWSLIDFANVVQDELVTLEIEQRCRVKLAAHEEIAVESINVAVEWSEDNACVGIAFRLIGEDELRQLNIIIGKTQIEVTNIAE